MENIIWQEILQSKEEKRILKGTITGIEDEYYKLQNTVITCAIIWYNTIKVLIPITHLGIKTENKSVLRGMLGALVDFIVMEVDTVSEIVVASRIEAMQLRSKIELPKLKINDVVLVRIVATARKHIIVDLYGKEIIIPADKLKHTYIVNCKNDYLVGQGLQVRVKKIDIENNIFELNAKELLENPFKKIRTIITEGGEYFARVIAFPKNQSGVIVQIENIDVTALCRIPGAFNRIPYINDKVLVKIYEIREDKKQIYATLKRIIGGV